ncbi:MAG TPA: sulfotransferase domain-containing protein [Xanthobacteraceae bacterium]|nr:sulfotransferase domain-containing protein [Xanthobacteraceae bacterium]
MTSSPAPAAAAPPRPKSGLIWLASYPKSGNTWTRIFLSNLAAIMAGETQRLELKALARFTHSADFRLYFEEILGFNPTDQHRDEIAATRQKVQQIIADRFEGLVFLKTHNALVNDRGYSVFNFAVTSGAVYIVRNPLDVAISLAHHGGYSIDKAIETMALEDSESPVDDKLVHEIWSSWSRHVASWTRKPHPAIRIMRYEDMAADPLASFTALARHLQLRATSDQISLAIERASFEAVRDEEAREGFKEKPKQAERFFREGRAGQWRDVLTSQQVDRIVGVHREQMQRFGYWPLG